MATKNFVEDLGREAKFFGVDWEGHNYYCNLLCWKLKGIKFKTRYRELLLVTTAAFEPLWLEWCCGKLKFHDGSSDIPPGFWPEEMLVIYDESVFNTRGVVLKSSIRHDQVYLCEQLYFTDICVYVVSSYLNHRNTELLRSFKQKGVDVSGEERLLLLPPNIRYFDLNPKSTTELMEFSWFIDRARPAGDVRDKAIENPCWAYHYAKYVDRYPREDTRNAVLSDPYWAYHYARYVDKGPSDETRIVASNDPAFAYIYAIEIDQDPHSVTRNGAQKDGLWNTYYQRWEHKHAST